MIKFKFISSGQIKPQDRRRWLGWISPNCLTLPTQFEFSNILPGTFKDSIMKRKEKAAQDRAARDLARKQKKLEKLQAELATIKSSIE